MEIVINGEGPLMDHVVNVLKGAGLPVVAGAIEACATCGFFDCVCQILAAHDPRCRRHVAAAQPIGITCEHGAEVCDQCDPCTCSEVKP